MTDGWDIDAKFLTQYSLDIKTLLPGQAGGLLKILRRNYAIADQKIIFGSLNDCIHSLAKGNGQRLAELPHSVLGSTAKRGAITCIDQLHHADQFRIAGIDHRRNQHLLGSITGLFIHSLQKPQTGMNTL